MVTKTNASQILYDDGTVQDVMDGAKSLQDYAALRAYTGPATGVRITTPGIAGFFQRDADVSTADNGGTIIVDASGRRWKRVFDGAISVKWFGAAGNGVDDDTQAFHKASQSGGLVEITPGIYYLSPSSLAALPNGRITLSAGTRFWAKDPEASVIKTEYAANPLIYSNQPNSSVIGVGFDFTGSVNAMRAIKADIGADGFKAKRVKIKGMTSAAFVRAIDIDDSVKGFEVSEIDFLDLFATANGVIGDNTGTCRGIYVGGSGVVPATLGHGRIRKIHGENLQTVEDADLIHIQTAATGIFNVSVKDVTGKNVAKRLVKIQANGVNCSDVHADAIDMATPMYSVVSAYANDCELKNISGIGQIKICADTSGSSSVDGVDYNLISEIAGSGFAARHEGSGSPNIMNVRARGKCRSAVVITSEVGAIDKVTVDAVKGESIEELVSVRAQGAHSISLVLVSGVKGKSTSSSNRSVFVAPASGASATVGSVQINDVTVENGGYFTSVEITASTVITDGITSRGETSTTLQINSATYADARDTKHWGKTATYGVLYVNCSNTLTDGVRTDQPTTTGSGVRYSGGAGHLWTNVFVPGGVPVTSFTGGASGIYGGLANTFAGTVRVGENLIRAAGSQWQFTGLGAAGWGAGSGHAWNVDPLRLGSNYLWVDATGKLRISTGAPASDTAGTVVGAQT